MLISTICLGIFLVLGAFDGFYFHLLKFELHKHAQTRREHLIHVVRGIVLIPYSYFFFVKGLGGAMLSLGLLLFVIDLGLEIIDVYEERNSRKIFGGLHAPECLIHILGSSAKFSASLLLIHLRLNSTLGDSIKVSADARMLRVMGLLLIIGCLLNIIFEVLQSVKRDPKDGRTYQEVGPKCRHAIGKVAFGAMRLSGFKEFTADGETNLVSEDREFEGVYKNEYQAVI